jgi:hypothetical protein
MIRKSGYRFSEKDHAQSRSWSAMTVQSSPSGTLCAGALMGWQPCSQTAGRRRAEQLVLWTRLVKDAGIEPE